jgi:hypothetical protein
VTAITTGTTQQGRARKTAAVLAGVLVLGVGIVATLVSWNDSGLASAGSVSVTLSSDSPLAHASTSTVTWRPRALVN